MVEEIYVGSNMIIHRRKSENYEPFSKYDNIFQCMVKNMNLFAMKADSDVFQMKQCGNFLAWEANALKESKENLLWLNEGSNAIWCLKQYLRAYIHLHGL